jgi:hypothetical protein
MDRERVDADPVESRLREDIKRMAAPVDEPSLYTELGERIAEMVTQEEQKRERKKTPRRTLRVVAVAGAAVVLIAAVAVGVIEGMKYWGGPDGVVVVTDDPAATTTEVSPTSSTDGSTTTFAGIPGDSAGEWAEIELPAVPSEAGEVVSIAVSDEYLLLATLAPGEKNALYAYSLVSGSVTEVATGYSPFSGADIDGNTAVWWEGEYDEATASYTDQHIYAYTLPDGPKVEVAAGEVSMPQIAGNWVTWVESAPWEANPEWYRRVPIYGATLDGETVSAPMDVAPSAVAYVLAEEGWSYSLSENYLAWEQGTANGGLEAGSYVANLDDPTVGQIFLGEKTWRPAVSGSNVFFVKDGLQMMDLPTGQVELVDADGDFPSAAPTFVAYNRSSDDEPGKFEVVVRGLTLAEDHEQVLSQDTDPQWMSGPIVVGDRYITFFTHDGAQLFEWKGSGE